MNNGKKMFIVRKYILASDASEAITFDKKSNVDEVFVDKEWEERNVAPPMGYK